MTNYGRELRMGTDIKRKRKICGKNEKGLGGSRSNSEEDMGRDKVINRQGKKKSRRVEKR